MKCNCSNPNLYFYFVLLGSLKILVPSMFLKFFHLFPDVLLDTLTHIMSKRGKPQVVDSRGFRYSKKQETRMGSTAYWTCVLSNTRNTPVNCKAKLTTGFDGKILHFSGCHNHKPTEYV